MIASLGLGGNYNFHYKEKNFPDKRRSKKIKAVREWESDRTNRFNLFISGGIGIWEGIYLFGEYYFTELMNRDFVEIIDDVPVQPYKDLRISTFSIGITWLFDFN